MRAADFLNCGINIDAPSLLSASAPPGFLAGVIEGFYGPPWSLEERRALFERMAAWGLNTYLYAPKDDLKHRALWREPYSPGEAESLRTLVKEARGRGLRFIWAIAPGLDVRYGDPAEFDRLVARLDQMRNLGCHDFALLFDDISDRMHPDDRARWSSVAEAQVDLTTRLCAWVRAQPGASAEGGRFLFCPTPYCGRMMERGLGGPGYLATVGRMLPPEIDVFWTGPEIISEAISVGHIRDLAALLGRKPLLWDNLHANDYDGRRFYCGPYAGRDAGIRDHVGGILINPNTEFPLNEVPVQTFAGFLRSKGSWNPREGYLEAMREWLPRFDTIGQPISFEDLVLLGDAYYLPHANGPEAQALLEAATTLLTGDRATWGEEVLSVFRDRASRLRECCARMAELRDRPLFHALGRRVWELREELDLLLGYVRAQSEPTSDGASPPVRSDFHLPGTYRGGFVPELQRLLKPHPDGTFTPWNLP